MVVPLSMRALLLRLRSLQEPCRTTTVPLIIGRRSVLVRDRSQQQIEFPDHVLTMRRAYRPLLYSIIRQMYPEAMAPWRQRGDYEHGSPHPLRAMENSSLAIGINERTWPLPSTGISAEWVCGGGGGTTPDIFVPEDALGMTSYFSYDARTDSLQFAFLLYTDDNRPKLNNFKESDGTSPWIILTSRTW